MYRLVIIAAAISLLSGCQSDNPTGSNPTPLKDLPYLEEAQEMALFYSGEFYPPERLTRRISGELSRLRNAFGDSIAIVNERFRPWWWNRSVHVVFDAEAEAWVLGGYHAGWNELIEQYDLTVYPFKPLERTFFYLMPEEMIHHMRLAERIRDMHIEGMTGAWLNERPHPYEQNIALIRDGRTTKYFTYWVPCHDYGEEYDYFEITPLEDKHVANYRTCPRDLPAFWSLPWEEQDRILDSLEANRPAWVDTARIEFRRIELGILEFHWEP